MGPGISELANGTFEFVSKKDFVFEDGGIINPMVLVYECYGLLNEAKDNTIIVHHALSTSSHLAATEENP